MTTMISRSPAALGLLAIALVLMLAASACNRQADAPRAVGLWFAFPESSLGREGPIRIVHVDSGFEDEVGPSGTYRNVAWAPGGERIAAIRLSAGPELVVFDLVDDDAPVFVAELEVEDVQLSWSPDANRLLVLSADDILLFDPELEVLARVGPPEEAEAAPGYARGMWSDDSSLFAAVLHGYLVVVDRVGRAHFHDPAGFVRYPDQTRDIAIMSWETQRALAVFEDSEDAGPRRYVLSVGGPEIEVLSSSDFEVGAGPFDGILRLASEAAGGSDVFLGLSSAPPKLRWVVATAGPGDVPVRVFVRDGDIFLAASTGLFAQVDPEELARDLSVMLVPAPHR